MKKSIKRITALLIIFCLIFSQLPVMASAATTTSLRLAKITAIDGPVKVFKGGGSKSFPAFKGMSMMEGDKLVTGIGGSVTFDLEDDKVITVSQNTQLMLSELVADIKGNTATSMNLMGGKVLCNIKKKLTKDSNFEIKTPTAVMGVRGTMFFVGQEEGKTDVAVLEGTVVATTYIPPQESGGGTGGTTEQQPVEVVLQKNEQISLDQTITQEQVQQQVEQVTTESLDLMVLESIVEDPSRVDQSLLENIDQVIEQRQEEQQQQIQEQLQQQQQSQQQALQQQTVYNETIVPEAVAAALTQGVSMDSMLGLLDSTVAPPAANIFNNVVLPQGVIVPPAPPVIIPPTVPIITPPVIPPNIPTTPVIPNIPTPPPYTPPVTPPSENSGGNRRVVTNITGSTTLSMTCGIPMPVMFTYSPINASYSVTSSDSSKVSATIISSSSGYGGIQIVPNAVGTATITLTGVYSGYASSVTTIQVTVAVAPISQSAADALTAIKLVVAALNSENFTEDSWLSYLEAKTIAYALPETTTAEVVTKTSSIASALALLRTELVSVTANGTAQVGSTLTATLTPTGTATYQWMRGDSEGGTFTNIESATSATYVLTSDDLDKYIKVVATGSESFVGTVTSAVRGPIVVASDSTPPGYTSLTVEGTITAAYVQFNEALHSDTLAISDRTALLGSLYKYSGGYNSIALTSEANSVTWDTSIASAPVAKIIIPGTTFAATDKIDFHFNSGAVKDLASNAVPSGHHQDNAIVSQATEAAKYKNAESAATIRTLLDKNIFGLDTSVYLTKTDGQKTSISAYFYTLKSDLSLTRASVQSALNSSIAATSSTTQITAFDAITPVAAGTAGNATYASATAVRAVLPATVTANSAAVTVPVTSWTDTDTYNPALAGSYTFTAVLGTIPAGFANAGNYTATVEVVVTAAGVITPTSATIGCGAYNPNVTVNLANDIFTATGTSDNTSNWTVSEGSTGLTLSSITRSSDSQAILHFAGTAAIGTLTIKANAAALTLGAASNTVNLTVPTPTEITAFDAITPVAAGTAGNATYANATAVRAVLPATVTANSAAVTVPVTSWTDTDTYNPASAGSYTFTAVLGTIPAGFANTGNYTATVEVVVAAPAVIAVAPSTVGGALVATITLTNDTFTAAGTSELIGSWTIDLGSTGLTSFTIAKIDPTTATITFNVGVPAPGGTITIKANAAALTGGVGSNTVSISIPS